MSDITNNFRGNYRLAFSYTAGEVTQSIFGDTIDDLIEGLAILKKPAIVLAFVSQFSSALSDEQFRRLDSLMIEVRDTTSFLHYVKVRKTLSNVNDFEKAFWDSKNISLILAFYTTCYTNYELIPAETIENLQNLVLEANDPECMYKFARIFAPLGEIDLEKLQKALIQTGDCFYMDYFATTVQGADVKALRDAIRKSKQTV